MPTACSESGVPLDGGITCGLPSPLTTTRKSPMAIMTSAEPTNR
jgi:hypothetical protein